MVPALVAVPAVAGSPVPEGPLNVLVAGIDPRGSHTVPLADTIIVVHVPASRDGAFVFSLPRDLVVRIPGFAASGSAPQRGKINAAMGLGARTGPGRYDPAQGWRLLARTVGAVTGIARFDAGVVVDFGGLQRVVAALGGVRMPIDQEVVSEHRRPDGSPRDRLPDCGCLRPYTGPQQRYRPSAEPVLLRPWQALDFVRQRYGLPGSDYDRQRHQRQLLEAVAGRLRVAGPRTLLEVADAVTVVDRGAGVAAWAAVLRQLPARAVTGVGLRGAPVFEGGGYVGERVDAAGFFAAVAGDRVAAFLVDHPGAVTVDDQWVG